MGQTGLAHEVTEKLVVIIACFAVLAFIGSRRWLRPTETTVIGIAMIFWAAGWLMLTLFKLTQTIYGPDMKAALLAGLMTFPMVLAMAVGLWLLVRAMKRDPAPRRPGEKPKSKPSRR